MNKKIVKKKKKEISKTAIQEVVNKRSMDPVFDFIFSGYDINDDD